MVVDGQVTLDFYFAMCEQQGLPRPRVLVEMWDWWFGRHIAWAF